MRAGERRDHGNGGLPFGGASRLGDAGIRHQAVAVLHQGVTLIAEIGLPPLALAYSQDSRSVVEACEKSKRSNLNFCLSNQNVLHDQILKIRPIEHIQRIGR